MYALLESHLAAIIGFLVCFFLIARILREHYRPAVSIAWFLAIVLVPYVGVPAYLLFGGRKLKRMAQRKRGLYPQRTQGQPRRPPRSLTPENLLVAEGMPPARYRNAAQFLDSGEDTYECLTRLIREAEHSLDVMTFILGRDSVGRSIVDLLSQKAADGVRVRLLLDALGCMWTSRGFVKPLREAGGEVGVFMSVLPVRRRWSANLRNHRKVVIADQTRGLIGGINLASEYIGPEANEKRWVDTSLLVNGPVVDDLGRIFSNDWAFARGMAPPPQDGFSKTVDVPHQGSCAAQVVASGPDVDGDPLYDAILTAAYRATERIWVATPYFVPDEGLQKALLVQSRLGLDVRIMLPDPSNHPLADLARGPFLRNLQDAGARIFFLQGRMNHAKHVVFDHSCAVAGSANLDMRSLYLNYEVAMFLYSRPEVRRIAEWMEKIMNQSVEMKEPQKVGFLRQWAEDAASLVSPLL